MAHVVDEVGYAGATVAAITASAGVSRRTFYEHFRDKEHCFLTAFERIVGLLYDAVAGSYAREEAWPDRVESGLSRLLAMLAANPVFARLYASKSTEAGPTVLDARAVAVERFTEFIHAGNHHPGAIEQPVLIARVVVAGAGDVVSGEIAAARAERLPALLPDLLYALLLPYLGPQEADALRRRAAEGVVLLDDPD